MGHLVLALAAPAVDHRDPGARRPRSGVGERTARPRHQVRVIQPLVVGVQPRRATSPRSPRGRPRGERGRSLDQMPTAIRCPRASHCAGSGRSPARPVEGPGRARAGGRAEAAPHPPVRRHGPPWLSGAARRVTTTGSPARCRRRRRRRRAAGVSVPRLAASPTPRSDDSCRRRHIRGSLSRWAHRAGGAASQGPDGAAIAATCPLERVQDAYGELERRHTRGKIVMVP